jgi:hypothetical protein
MTNSRIDKYKICAKNNMLFVIEKIKIEDGF